MSNENEQRRVCNMTHMLCRIKTAVFCIFHEKPKKKMNNEFRAHEHEGGCFLICFKDRDISSTYHRLLVGVYAAFASFGINGIRCLKCKSYANSNKLY